MSDHSTDPHRQTERSPRGERTLGGFILHAGLILAVVLAISFGLEFLEVSAGSRTADVAALALIILFLRSWYRGWRNGR